tara:strand:+ start:19102 stop:19506 length:405 start_codon:yes stop_codon:yes gene_type:complete
MTVLSFILVAVLALVALVHALWGFGIWFPIRDEERLVRCVVGAGGATRMPGPIPCALVAIGLIVVICALLAQPSWTGSFVLWLSATVFFLRGVLAWVPMWRKMTPQEPFATLDRYVYGPACIALGASIAAVLLG